MAIFTVLILLSMAFALWQWWLLPRPKPGVFVLFGVLVVLAMLTELIGGYMNARRINNTVLYNLFTLVEAFLVLAMIARTRKSWRKGMAIAAAGVALVYGISILELGISVSLLHEAIILTNLLLVALCLAVLWEMAQNTIDPLVRQPYFWLFLGFVVYFAGIVPMIGLLRFVYLEDWRTAVYLYKIVPMICIIRYLLAAYACILARNRRPALGTIGN